MARAIKNARALHPGKNSSKVTELIVGTAAPSSNLRRDIGTDFIDKTNKLFYKLVGYDASGNPVWQNSSGTIQSINGLTPADGAMVLNGTSGQIAVTDDSDDDITFALADGIPRSVAVSLTAAQVKALATTPVELVAAPGAGKAIKFMGASLKLVYGSEVFAESGDNLGIKYTDASGVQVSQAIETTGFIDQSADTYTNAEPAIDGIVAATGAENQALVLDNLNANITGNASNDSTLEISVCYRILEL